MIVYGKPFVNVHICKVKNKENKFFVKRGNELYYLKKGKWRRVVATSSQLRSIDFYRFSSYKNKKFLPFKNIFFDFISNTFT